MGKDLYKSLQNLQNLCDDGNFDEFKKYFENYEIRKRQEIVQKKLQDGQTFLIAACKKGHYNIVRFLVEECKADIEQVASVKFDGEQVEGVPPLWCASAAGHLQVVELLVSKGAKVNRTTITNSTALRAACFDGHLDVVEFLVNKGADIEIPNRHGHTCLMISCYRGHATIVNFLLEHGARVNRQSAKGNTALHDCAESGNLEGLKLLLQYNAVMKEDEYGMTPIMAGANSGYKNIVEHMRENYSNQIPEKEIAMSYELLGTHFLDRQNLTAQAKEAWKLALNLYSGISDRQNAKNDSKISDDSHNSDMDWVDGDIDCDAKVSFLGADSRDGTSDTNALLDSVSEVERSNMEISTEEDDDKSEYIHDYQQSAETILMDPNYLKIHDLKNGDESRITDHFSKRRRRRPDRMKETRGEFREFHDECNNERLIKCSKQALGDVREFTTEEELDNLEEHSDDMKLQTLLIRLRILGPDHPDTIYYIRYRGAIYADSGNIQRCLNLWMYALELQKIYLEPLCHVAQSAFLSFAELFSYILSEQYTALPAVCLEPNLLIDCLELCVDSIERGIEFSFYQWRNKQNWSYTSADKDASNLFKQTSLCLIFMAMISHHYIQENNRSRLQSLFTDSMSFRFKKQVYRLVKLDPRLYQGQTLLHLACSRETAEIGRLPICDFPNYPVVKLLLETGKADPNISDAQGSTPLEILSVAALRKPNNDHRLASNNTPDSLKELMKLLLDNGAHLDVKHKTSSFRNMSTMDLLNFYQDHDINPIKYMTLGCWCQLSLFGRNWQAEKINRLTHKQFCIHNLKNFPDEIQRFIHMHR